MTAVFRALALPSFRGLSLHKERHWPQKPAAIARAVASTSKTLQKSSESMQDSKRTSHLLAELPSGLSGARSESRPSSCRETCTRARRRCPQSVSSLARGRAMEDRVVESMPARGSAEPVRRARVGVAHLPGLVMDRSVEVSVQQVAGDGCAAVAVHLGARGQQQQRGGQEERRRGRLPMDSRCRRWHGKRCNLVLLRLRKGVPGDVASSRGGTS